MPIPSIPATPPSSLRHRRGPGLRRAETALAAARRFDEPNGLTWLTPARANNTWQIAVSGKLARAENLRTMADFAVRSAAA